MKKASEEEINNPDLEAQYQLYIQSVDLTEDQMHPQQRVQLKQAFMAACAQLLLLLRNAQDARGPEATRVLMSGMIKQTVEFWNKEFGITLSQNDQLHS